MSTIMYRLYLTFYIASVIRVLGRVPIFFIYFVFGNYDTNEEGYFYLGARYEEIDMLCLSLVLIITCIERLPYYVRFGLFTVYAVVDLIISLMASSNAILLQDYDLPMISENKILFFIAVGISIYFKITHILITVAIFININSIPLDILPFSLSYNIQEGRGEGRGEVGEQEEEEEEEEEEGEGGGRRRRRRSRTTTTTTTTTRREYEVIIPLVELSPPPYEHPPSYIVAVMGREEESEEQTK